jgi:hypothetical protein
MAISVPLPLLRRYRHQFVADWLEVAGGEHLLLFGIVDQQGQVAEAVDAAGNAAGEFLQRGQGVELYERLSRTTDSVGSDGFSRRSDSLECAAFPSSLIEGRPERRCIQSRLSCFRSRPVDRSTRRRSSSVTQSSSAPPSPLLDRLLIAFFAKRRGRERMFSNAGHFFRTTGRWFRRPS